MIEIDEKTFKKPDWYLQIPELNYYFFNPYNSFKNLNSDLEKENFKKIRNDFFIKLSSLLKENKIKLSNVKELIFDNERKLIDTVVIHHTNRDSRTSLDLLEAIFLIQLYAKEFSNKSNQYYGKAIFSGHLRKNKQTFFPYHYLIMPDGDVIQTLEEKYIGWHSGNWDYNCRSIAIAFHDNLEAKKPTEEAIKSAKTIIDKYKPKNILGHREIVSYTSCPGNLFLGENGWKKRL
jgi:hypothetical protein